MTDFIPKLVHLPNTALSPKVVLHRTLDKIDHIKSVVVIIQWNNDEFATDWSQMKVSELCMATMHLQEAGRKTLFDGENR